MADTRRSLRGGGLCAVCFGAAGLPCPRCQDETYCGERHLADDAARHSKWCFRRTEAAQNPTTVAVTQDAAILAQSVEVLLRVCRCLGALDLARLGLACRRLRALCRDRRAWSHVAWAGGPAGVLLLAPALCAIHLGEAELTQPPVNLLRTTRVVRELHLAWDEYTQDDYDVDRVMALLGHYRGHLEVVSLGCLQNMVRPEPSDDMKLLRFIDGLNIKELYVKGCLAKVYPRSSKVVTHLEMGIEVSEDVLKDFLSNCRNTLVSFKTRTAYMRKNEWVQCDDSGVRGALARCRKLQEAAVRVWDGRLPLRSWPALRTLCLFDVDATRHAAAATVLRTAPAARHLQSLTLWMEMHAHRGLLVAVAEACTALRQLHLKFGTPDGSLRIPVDVPRDLHAILGALLDLEELTLFVARVPSTVFRGIADGALPGLQTLSFESCSVTPKGREALEQLRGRRPDVQLPRCDVAPAKLGDDWGPYNLSRCAHAACAALSDCEEEDPVTEGGEGGVAAAGMGPIY